ncbi:MAG: YraN family protein [Clostridiales bacterium]|nr:YraN family protein [Clostridiales bacterium]
MNKREVGSLFEEKAAKFLISHGYQIIQKNFYCKMGEIDIIAKSEGYLCFIEVKYRSSEVNGTPGEAISPRKIRRITRTAQYYMLINNIPEDTPCRFDVILILDNEITLITNAFDGIL